jgi:hypothetical protein
MGLQDAGEVNTLLGQFLLELQLAIFKTHILPAFIDLEFLLQKLNSKIS